MMLAGRFLQGIGVAGPRTITLALVRDRFEGREMARVMSLITVVFILVPDRGAGDRADGARRVRMAGDLRCLSGDGTGRDHLVRSAPGGDAADATAGFRSRSVAWPPRRAKS